MIRRVCYKFTGIVQGVGFRPFIYRLAVSHGLAGFVQNSTEGVVVEVQGQAEAIEAFIFQASSQTPPLAEIYDMSSKEIPIQEDNVFRILESSFTGRQDVHISPDIATCDECLAELFDPADRRYRYPFINCTNCGPRLTIIRDIPYDRMRTSMACFPLCEQCGKEYADPVNRRFHAEPNACSVCGPHLTLLDREGKDIACEDAVAETIRLLKAGSVMAVKGLGGFHLAADAGNDDAVGKLRKKKFREEKPLAIMVPDIQTAEGLAVIDEEERQLLTSLSRPIVLVEARRPSPVSHLVAPGMCTLGIMLPYTPLHHLLLQGGFTALVMTSANQTDEPICIENSEAVQRLSGIAEYFLVHNREILVRCDDSVSMVSRGRPYVMRRSRGYAPRPLLLKEELPEVLAVGGHLKSAICIIKKGGFAYLSPHIGDLETSLARDFLHETVERMQHIVQCTPRIAACDLHPRYYSTRAASLLDVDEIVQVQHHHAHIVSCMAENRVSGKVIGLAMDGTGYGEDGTIWGGEFLVADEIGFERAGHLKYFALPGGEIAIKQPWRIAASVIRDAYGSDWADVACLLGIVPAGISCDSLDKILDARMFSPLCSSLGRLFDGISSILDLKQSVNYEGQAAIELESAARSDTGDVLPYAILEEGETLILDPAPMVRAIVERRMEGIDCLELASSFHRTLEKAFVDMVKKIRCRTGIDFAALSGGCFQNRILLEGCAAGLEKEGLTVLTHQRVPANDGGIALGQAVVAGKKILAAKG